MKVLILAPHTDDGELGCGGTIAKLIEEKNDVYYAAFSLCESSVPQGLPKNILEVEVKAATEVLGVKPENLLLYKYQVRHFTEERQNILDDLIKIKKEISPKLIFIPSINDIHQDHSVIAIEAIRAFKNASILGYEMVWNNLTFSTTSFMKLEKHHIDKKIEALACYTSQGNIRNYMNRSFIESLARTRGVQIATEFAESFEVIRWII
jgi:LmbE family N-acetylglucosaminyl deacetylase